MKKRYRIRYERLLLPGLVLLVATAVTASAQGLFQKPWRLQTQSGKVIDTGDGSGYAGPTLADVDGDDRPDLVVGQFTGGRFRVYKNVGTTRKPVYADHEFLAAGKTLASVPMG